MRCSRDWEYQFCSRSGLAGPMALLKRCVHVYMYVFVCVCVCVRACTFLKLISSFWFTIMKFYVQFTIGSVCHSGFYEDKTLVGEKLEVDSF